MTNDNLKRDIRAYKKTFGVNHTTARRIVMSASRGRGASRIEPPVALRLLRGHPWADLVLDGRSVFQADERLTGSLGAPLAEATMKDAAGGDVLVTLQAYLPPEWKGSAVTTIAYPDGFTLAHVSSHLADYHCTAGDVEETYRNHSDVFRDLLFPADAGDTTPREQVVRRAGDAVAWIRRQAHDPTVWFGGEDPSAGTGTLSSSAIEVLWTGAAVGFSREVDAEEVFNWLPHQFVRDAVDAEFDLDDPNHRKWLWHSARYAWPWFLDGGWATVKELHDAGWSLRALRELCSGYSIDFHYGRRETVAFADTDGPAWVQLMGSPADANLFLEAHVSLHRGEAQIEQKLPLGDLLEDDIVIDDVVDWVDRYMAALRGFSDEVVTSAETPIPLLVKAAHLAWKEPESAFIAGRFIEQEGSWYLILHSQSGWTLTQVPAAVDAFELPAHDAFYGHGARWPDMSVAERRQALLTWADEDAIFTCPDAVLDNLRENGQMGNSFELQTRVFASMMAYFTDAQTRETIGRRRWRALLRASEGGVTSRSTLRAGDV